MRMRLLVLALGTAISGSAMAIANQEYASGLQFNFTNPGARSLGMGGAYLGFSDDATAAYTNPAGLTILGQPEITVEFRRAEFDTPFISGGTSPGGITTSTASSNTTNPSYMAVVYPGDGWAMAWYRQVLVDYDTSFVKNQIPTPAGTIFAARSEAAIAIENIGVSGAYEFSDQFSFGLSILHSSLEFAGVSVRSNGAALVNAQAESAHDSKMTFNAGALYKLNDQWSFGTAYRRGPRFNMRFAASNLDAAGNFTGTPTIFGTNFNTPHQFGVGAAFRANERLSIGFDVNFVRYSRLGEESAPQLTDYALEIDNGVELRIGGEYVFDTMSNPFTLRAGVWRDPEHRLKFNGTDLTNADAILFPEGDDNIHFTAGFGWVIGRFQIDGGADFSDEIDTVSLSTGVRF